MLILTCDSAHRLIHGLLKLITMKNHLPYPKSVLRLLPKLPKIGPFVIHTLNLVAWFGILPMKPDGYLFRMRLKLVLRLLIG